MKTIFFAVACLFATSSFCQQDHYAAAWKALNANRRTDAEKLLQQAIQSGHSGEDAFITNLYLQTYNGKEKEIKNFITDFYDKAANPYPYIFALWFNQAVAGSYGKKIIPGQLKILDRLLHDDKAPGTLVAAANYQTGMHYLFSGELDKAQRYFTQTGSIRHWQYTGPFENLSGSGFYKDYGPLAHPEPGAVFTSLTNASVKWFTPASENSDGWIPFSYQFNKSTAVSYAQSFVTSPADQAVYCNVGFSGSVKVWINDELVISDPHPRVTEMDQYTVKYTLRKGVNRVLVQVGYTNESYPNFMLRFTDEKNFPIPGISSSPQYAAYPSKKAEPGKYELLPHFAEKFFTEKIKAQPGNPVNYLLLADVYLRSLHLLEAHDLLNTALQKAPSNSLLREKLLEVINKENNRTLYLEEFEKIKKADPESVLVLDEKIRELYNNEKYEDCEAALQNRIRLIGEDENTDGYRLMLIVQEKKYDDLVKVAEKTFARYPDNPKLLKMMYSIRKDVYKDNKGAFKVYENFMKNNYNYEAYTEYADLLIEQGNTRKGVEVRENLSKNFPYDPNGLYQLSRYYFGSKDYNKAEEYIRKALDLSPFNEILWGYLGDIKNEKNQTTEALDAYNQSLKYDPNQYEVISKIRKLNNKPEIYKLFDPADIDKIIAADNAAEAKNTDYGYYYILDRKDVVIYPDGANEEYVTTLLRITNNKGVERFKESSIGYGNTQSLLIEKAQIIKKNQARIDGERNGNEVVFTNLEAGDIIVFKYRLQSYVYGRFAKDFWDKYYFGGQIYSAITEYNLLAPKDLQIQYRFSPKDLSPRIREVEDCKLYSWVISKPEPLKSEPFMPLIVDVGDMLHISTVPAWKDIANWYSDVSNDKSEEDFEIRSLYNRLFPEGSSKLSQFEKAKKIYEYIEENIRYSSVSFRQSAFVPQRASATLTTRLGDCKDLSNLFVTLARMAGMEAQMVLVDTRDNGQKDMLLPSIEFNHCIVKALLDGKSYYIELTDNYLPFTALPNTLNGALALEIPVKSGVDKAELVRIQSPNRVKDVIKRDISMTPQEDDIAIRVKTVKYGAFSSDIREQFGSLDEERKKKEMEETVARSYKNNIRLEEVQFADLSKLHDSAVYEYSYVVKNEVIEIGSLHTFKIIYPDIVASLDNFSADKRDFPIEYWRYENADAYETVVHINAPQGKKFAELPQNVNIHFKGLQYSLTYSLKSPDRLVVTRRFTDGREQQIAAADYPAFKSFFEKIVKAEQKFIAYK